MVLLLPRPWWKGSKTSPTSVCIISLTSMLSLPSVPPIRPRKVPTSAMLSRMVCQAITGCCRPSSAHRPAWVSIAPVSSDASVPAAPANSPTSTRSRSCAMRSRWRCTALSRPAIL
jgi:hypothetical protein